MKKNCDRLCVLACALIVCILIWGCPANQAPAGGQSAAAKEQQMKHDSTAEQLQAAAPLIDVEVPAKFDTATFGLG